MRQIVTRQELLERKEQKRLWSRTGYLGCFPLDAPGLPPVGPNFLLAATDGSNAGNPKKGITPFYGEQLKEMHRRVLRQPGYVLPVQTVPGVFAPMKTTPGHLWGQNLREFIDYENLSTHSMAPPVDGPRPAEVMLVGKAPTQQEVQSGRLLLGPAAELLTDLLRQTRFTGMVDWYVTNVLKFALPEGATRIRSEWLRDAAHLLMQEIKMVRPRFILCLGSEAVKAVLGDSHGITNSEGLIFERTYDGRTSADEPKDLFQTKVVTVTHPSQVLRSPESKRVLQRGIQRFFLVTKDLPICDSEADLDHRVCTTWEQAVAIVREAESDLAQQDKKMRLVAWDAEWQGRHPINPGSYVRTVQMSWKPKNAICFKLRHAGGDPSFFDAKGEPAEERLMRLLTRFMADKRPVFHFGVADMEWLQPLGLDLLTPSRVPIESSADGRSPWQRLTDGEGGLDTAYMAHAIDETSLLGLESLAMQHTSAPRYDTAIEAWKKQHLNQHQMKTSDLRGYGDIPDEILLPYSMFDSDTTLRIALKLLPLLDCDYNGHNVWEPFWESMIIQPVILEIHQQGLLVCRDRIKDLTDKFVTARQVVEQRIREQARWPEMNLRSLIHVKEYLFGTELNGVFKAGKNNRAEGEYFRVRPAGAVSLRIVPLTDTGKPPKKWTDIVAAGKEREHNPSTGKIALAILAQDNEHVGTQVNDLRDYRFLDQVVKTVLREPEQDAEGYTVIDDDGNPVYEAGLPSCIDVDNRVRTSVRATAETGRWKSSRPNLQNISSARDKDYRRLLGKENYKHKLRSIFMADPGEVLIEADYKGAELYAAAIVAGDDNLISHAQRNQLDDGETPGKPMHPDYYDIHSNVAVNAFKLTCAPIKQILEDLGLKHLRIAAKSVIFGLFYGRGAKAIAFAVKAEGVSITENEAQKIIDSVFEAYPRLLPYFAACRERATEERWLCSSSGRFRRFPPTSDRKTVGEFERQAMNFGIQGLVASCLNRGAANMTAIRDNLVPEFGHKIFNWKLTIHDAILIGCKPQYAEYLKDELIPYAMCKSVPIYPADLNGIPNGRGPYFLGVDTHVFSRWGEA